MKDYFDKIISVLELEGKKGVSKTQFRKKTRIKNKILTQILSEYVYEGRIALLKGVYYSLKSFDLHHAKIIRARSLSAVAETLDGEQVFIRGRHLQGAMRDDYVLFHYMENPVYENQDGKNKQRPKQKSKKNKNKSNSHKEPEKKEISQTDVSQTDKKLLYGKVFSVYRESEGRFSGIYDRIQGEPAVINSTMSYKPVFIDNDYFINSEQSDTKLCELTPERGDRVIAKVTFRGLKHSQHKCVITDVLGKSKTAKSAAQALIKMEDIPVEFPKNILNYCNKLKNNPIDISGRLDLRNELTLTIDGEDAKDLDDAVSLVKNGETYQLGVHIADVSHFVKPGTLLDKEAFNRGTSVYFPDGVIPMLPPVLSNDLCSLNPGEDKLTFSAIITLDFKGKVVNFQFAKAVINSKIRGVYSEINTILDKTADVKILRKYKKVSEMLFVMKELADILSTRKKERGAPVIHSDEPKFILDENGQAIDILPREMGVSESIIEEFMLTANECAAKFAEEHELPFVYRVHEPPTVEKINSLREVLQKLGIKSRHLKPGLKAKAFADILENSRDFPFFVIINKTILRSMMKARYHTEPLGHFGLSLKHYTHFTSPIRRYPDLIIHRIMSMFLGGKNKKLSAEKAKKLQIFASKAAVHSSACEIRAIFLELEADDLYKAEYMKSHKDEEFEGVISFIRNDGFFVKLPNTVEGFVRIEMEYKGEYVFDGMFELKNVNTGQKWRIGDSVKVKCTEVNVNEAKINFEIFHF